MTVKTNSRLAGFTFLIGLTTLFLSQDSIYKHFVLQDGSASHTIHSIFQDKECFLWLGTESGLCRYGGTTFTTFTIKDGIDGNEVFGMFQDRKGGPRYSI
ncbi:MAG TPA: two-component regulator propeller domain-containing protein [Flavitalea sp.]|nr:two-component regulator propeller domain-containing protein [Flavitalea sp.]